MPKQFLFLSAGGHARESIDGILERKLREIDDCGFALWGYGGSLGSPNPETGKLGKFLEEFPDCVDVFMRGVMSRGPRGNRRASEMGVADRDWEPIPAGINCRGSKWALVLGRIQRVDFELDLSKSVTHGRVNGGSGAVLLGARADQGRLCRSDGPLDASPAPIAVQIHATLTGLRAVSVR